MTAIRESLVPVLERMLPRPAVRSILATLPQSANSAVGTLDVLSTRDLLGQVTAGLQTFGGRVSGSDLEALRAQVTGGKPSKAVESGLRVASDHDVLAMQRLAQPMLKGFFGATDCVRLTTVISELARNIYMYAREGDMKLGITEEGKRVRLDVLAIDQGPGIADLEAVLAGRYQSKTGLGKGLFGAKRIFDELEISTAPGRGTTVRATKRSRG
jgi:serine/threonine-protein kinase RsbT